MYRWLKIKELKNNGKGIKEIARELGMSKNTVRKYLREESPPKYKKTIKRTSQWEKYRSHIEQMMYNKKLKPSVIYENLVKQGVISSISSFYYYLNTQKIKNNIDFKLSMRFETKAGVQIQFDWSEYIVFFKETGKQKVYIITLILGFSRYRFNVASQDVTQISILQAIEICFYYFGGVAEEMLIDNPRQLVDNASRKDFKLNKKFEEFAAFYGIRIVACKVRHPQTKGKVENPYYYLENHFIKNKEFKDFVDFSKQLTEFTKEINKKYHRGLKGIPQEVFEKEEKGKLKPLPKNSYFDYFCQEIRKVDHTSMINYKEIQYSVPVLYVKQEVRVEKYLGYLLKIYSLYGKLIAEHLIPTDKSRLVINKEHFKEFLKKKRQDYSGVKKDFLKEYPDTVSFVEKLKENIGNHYLRELSKIFSISKYYSKEDVKEAFSSCARNNIYCYEIVHSYLKNNCDIKNVEPTIISKRLDELLLNEKEIKRPLNYYDKLQNNKKEY